MIIHSIHNQVRCSISFGPPTKIQSVSIPQATDAVTLGVKVGAIPAIAPAAPPPHTIPLVVRHLASMKIDPPNVFERFWNSLKSLFLVVDPNQDIKDQITQTFGHLNLAQEMIQAYGTDVKRLESDLRRLLPLSNPQLDRNQIAEFAHLMAKTAQIVASNRINREGLPTAGNLPTRPIAVEATPFPQQDIMVDGMRLRYIDVSPLKPRGTLLFVHGHQSTLEEFNELIPILSKEYRILAVDLPGSGYSEQPDRDYSLEFFEDTLLHFMDKLGVQQATVAGGSLGGNMALRLGRRAPDRFPTVVSWSPAGVWTPKRFMATMAKTKLMTDALYWPMLKFQSKHWYREDFPNKEELIYASMRYRREVDSPIFRRSTGQIAAQQLRESHRGLGHLNKQPTLLMVGREDTGLDLGKNALEFAKELPNKQLVIFEKTGHSIHTEHPKEISDKILTFLNRYYPPVV